MEKGVDYELLSEHEDTQKFHAEKLQGLVEHIDYELVDYNNGLAQQKEVHGVENQSKPELEQIDLPAQDLIQAEEAPV